MSGKKFKYRPEIDGLRAISVIAVLLFHADLGFHGGFVGVDVFFVISGFLITSLLMRDIVSEKFTLADFWERRVRRIVPALAAVLIPVLIAGYFIMLPGDLVELGESAIAQAVILANVYFWNETGYFAGPADLKPLLHTWSLAVEEQFYLFFPIFLYAIAKWFPKRITLILGAIFVASFALNIYAVQRYMSATFFLLPTRAWELLAGSLIAVNQRPEWTKSRSISEFGSFLSLGLIFFAIFAFDKTTVFPGWAATLPILGATGYIFFNSDVDELTTTGKFLATKPMVFIGLISYSLYLWHWPILAYLRYMINDCSPMTLSLGCLASVGCAAVSYWYVEQPFRKRTLCATRQSAFTSTLVYLAGLVLVGFLFIQASGWPSRFDPQLLVYLEDTEHSGEEYQTTLKDLNQHGLKPIGQPGSGTPDFAIIGDSHAMAVIHLLDDIAKEQGISGVVATNNTTIPLPDVWSSRKEKSGTGTVAWNKKVTELVKASGVKNVVLIAAWNCYFDGWSQERLASDPKLLLSRGYATATPSDNPTAEGARRALEASLEKAMNTYQESGARVWIMPQVPEAIEKDVARRFLRWKLYPTLNSPMSQSGRPIQNHRERSRAESVAFKKVSGQDHVSVIDLMSVFFKGGEAANHYENTAMYRDVGHLTKSGADTKLRPVFEPLLQEFGRSE